MTTKTIITEFAYGKQKGKASSLSIDGDKLFNYGTVIAQRINGVIVLNMTKYSMTTTKHQNRLKAEFPQAKTMNDIPMWAKDLSVYL